MNGTGVMINYGWRHTQTHEAQKLTVLPERIVQMGVRRTCDGNLRDIVVQLLDSGARQLVWASATVVPEGKPGRIAGEEVVYNAAAAEAMADNGVIVNDLHTVSSKVDPSLFRGDFHYTAEGSRLIAQQVPAHTRAALQRWKRNRAAV